MTAIVTSDIHLTDNERDRNRWNLFEWLAEQIEKQKATELLILGDLCDAKDRHPARLVNSLVGILDELASMCSVKVLMGNHDYIDPQFPFFGFTEYLKSGVSFISFPSLSRVCGKPTWFFPSTKNWQADWDQIDFSTSALIFTHQTYDGAVVENGTVLPGIPPSYFKDFKGKVYSGDIHVPQKVSKNIEYIGAPYRIRFGDKYTPRVLLINDDLTTRDLHFPCPNKLVFQVSTTRDLEKCSGNPGDQVKVQVYLKRSDYDRWPALKKEIKDYAAKKEWNLFGPELIAADQPSLTKVEMTGSKVIVPTQVFDGYCKTKRVPKEIITLGKEILTEVEKEL